MRGDREERFSLVTDGGAWRKVNEMQGFSPRSDEWEPETLVLRLREALSGPVLLAYFLLDEKVILEKTGAVKDLGTETGL